MLGYKTSLKPFTIEILSSFFFNPKTMKLEKKMTENKKEVEKNEHLETKQHVAKNKQTSKNQQVIEEIQEENRKCLRAN